MPATIAENTTMMHIINLATLADSLHKQLSTISQPVEKQFLIQQISKSFSGLEISYSDIKVSNGKLHRLITPLVEIKRTQLLDMVAKSKGFKNHHAMKQDPEIYQPKQDLLTFEGSDNALAKFFTNKDKILDLFLEKGIKIDGFHINPYSKKIELMFSVPGKYVRSALQKEMNVFFRDLELLPYKNILEFPWSYSILDTKPAKEIVERFQTFFEPIWKEERNGSYSSIEQGAILPISFSNIQTKNDLLIVDGYSTDMLWKIVSSALNCALNVKDDYFWIDLIQILINVPVNKREYKSGHAIRMQSVIDTVKYSQTLDLESLKSDSEQKILELYKNKTFLFHLDNFYMPFINKFEFNLKRSIGSLIKETVIIFVEKHFEAIKKPTFSISRNPDKLMENLSPILYGKTHEELLDNDHIEDEHNARKAVQIVAYEIIEHIELIEKAIKRNIVPERN